MQKRQDFVGERRSVRSDREVMLLITDRLFCHLEEVQTVEDGTVMMLGGKSWRKEDVLRDFCELSGISLVAAGRLALGCKGIMPPAGVCF
jgi:hypothetical protein